MNTEETLTDLYELRCTENNIARKYTLYRKIEESIKEKDKEIERLNNIINEKDKNFELLRKAQLKKCQEYENLEKLNNANYQSFIEVNNIINELENYIGIKINSFGICNASDIYYKLQELKGSDKE